MRRLPDWEERLTAVLSHSFERKFQYGDFDCCLFACECIEAVTGEDLSLGLRGTYGDSIGAALAMRRAFGGGVPEIASGVAMRSDVPEIVPIFASMGDIVLAYGNEGPALGVCLGELVAIPDAVGLAMVGMTECIRAWRI